MNSDRLTGETDLAYEYYKIYRDMPPAERSLRTLCDREVTGKKRSEAVFKRWSSVHEWQKRVAAYDVAVERAAYEEQFALRKAEINDFISADLSIARRVQKMCELKLQALEQLGGDVDISELRKLALAYKESREWVKELTGFMFEEDTKDEEEKEAEG